MNKNNRNATISDIEKLQDLGVVGLHDGITHEQAEFAAKWLKENLPDVEKRVAESLGKNKK